MKPIRKAVFPVAGLGTRFLPATKATSKEMLPIVDRPLIQYAVDQAREAGIKQVAFVTGRVKSLEVFEPTQLGLGNCAYVRQQGPSGLGHANWCAHAVVSDYRFEIFLPDEFMVGLPGCMKQMVKAYDWLGRNFSGVV